MSTETPASTRSVLDRLLLAAPVIGLWLALTTLYFWQASNHPTPWLFSDEIEYTEIARAIAETGTPARRGVEYWGAGLYPWLVAPFWWIDDISSAYAAIKDVQALVMAAVVLPTYLLARTLLGRGWSLLAAAGAGVVPGLIYAPILIQEPFAYPFAATAFYVLVRALTARSRGWIVAAVALSLVAPQVRDELILIPLVAVLSTAIVALRSEWVHERTRSWSPFHRAGAAAAAALVLVGLSEAYALRSTEWRVARSDPFFLVEQAANAGAALAAGIAVLPVLAGIALALSPRSLPRTRAATAFHAVLLSALAGFFLYAGAKGVYGARTFEPRIVERNLIYLAPLLFVATALAARFRASLAAIGVAAALTASMILWTTYPLSTPLYGDAPSLAILTSLSSDHRWDQGEVERFLIVLLAVSVLVLLAARLQARVAGVIGTCALALAIGWSLNAEIVASHASTDFSRFFLGGLPKPLDWADQLTGGAPTLYLGQKIADPNAVWSLEFWNRSVRQIWSLDGTAPGPGPVLTPDLTSPSGTLADDPGYRYAISDFGVDLVGEDVYRMGAMTLVRLASPLRLEQSISGVFNDGWAGSESQESTVAANYSRFSTPGERAGTVNVRVARTGWCPSDPKADIPGRVRISVGTLALGDDGAGTIGKVTEERGWVVRGCGDRTFPIPTPPPPFHVRVTITPPFQPNALDPSNPERRWFGAQVGFDFVPSS